MEKTKLFPRRDVIARQLEHAKQHQLQQTGLQQLDTSELQEVAGGRFPCLWIIAVYGVIVPDITLW